MAKVTQRRFFYAGAPLVPGTCQPNNVTGECGHQHKTPEAAQRCIDQMDRAIKIGHGKSAYCDRIVMTAIAVGRDKIIGGSIQTYGEYSRELGE